MTLQTPCASVTFDDPPLAATTSLEGVVAQALRLAARVVELEAALRDANDRLREHEWHPIETLPQTGQALVTDDDPDDGDSYGMIELVCCPMLADGRLLNQNSGNYTRAGTWKWWRPVPPRKFKSSP